MGGIRPEDETCFCRCIHTIASHPIELSISALHAADRSAVVSNDEYPFGTAYESVPRMQGAGTFFGRRFVEAEEVLAEK